MSFNNICETDALISALKLNLTVQLSKKRLEPHLTAVNEITFSGIICGVLFNDQVIFGMKLKILVIVIIFLNND